MNNELTKNEPELMNNGLADTTADEMFYSIIEKLESKIEQSDLKDIRADLLMFKKLARYEALISVESRIKMELTR